MQHCAEVRAGRVCDVVDPEVGGTGYSGFSEVVAALGGAEGFDIHDHELNELLDIRNGGEGRAPVDWGGYVGDLKGVGVHKVDGCADAVTDCQRENVSDLLGKFDWKGNEVVFAYWH